MRWLAERDPARMSRLLGIPVSGAPQILPADFPVGKLSVDLLLRVGPRELAHVEYTVDVTSDLVSRMMIYRGLIQRAHPKHHITQHILVLGDGWVGKLLEFATRLATIRLDATTIKEIVKEAGMTVEPDIMMEIFRDTELAQSFLQKGRTEGRTEGREEGREELLAALLRERFGNHQDIPAMAHHLANGPNATSAVHAISTAATLDDLLALLPRS